MTNTGNNAAISISVEKTIAWRTSIDASRMVRPSDTFSPESRAMRNRRTMFSTSTMASSTTAPRAITRPARIIVLIIAPCQYNIIRAVSRDSGMAVQLIRAVRHSYRNPKRTMITSSAAMSRAFWRLLMDASINVAGRKIAVSIMISSGSPGLRAAIASSTSRETCSVLPQGNFSTIRSRPKSSLTTPSPIIGW